jgi:hypothetical protein
MKKKESERGTQEGVDRRSFLKRGAMAAGAATAGAMLLSKALPALAQDSGEDGKALTQGDIAILRFLAAAEFIESDLWIQYAELGGLTPGQVPVEVNPNQPMNSYQAALLEPRWRWPAIRQQQHAGRNQPRELLEWLPGIQRCGAGQLR